MNNNEVLTQIKVLETKLVRSFGGQILAYASILSPTKDITINFPKLTESSSKLLQKYIDTVRHLFKSINYKFESTSNTITNQFVEISKELYFTRYVQSKLLFAEYCLVRVPTSIENKMRKFLKTPTQEEAFLIQKDELIKTNEYNNYDITKNIAQERSSSSIALTLSVLPHVERTARFLLKDLKQITLKAMAPDIFIEELANLGAELSEYLFTYFGSQMYDYIKRGRSPKEARENVIAYYDRQIQPPARKFPASLDAIGDDVKKMLQNTFISSSDMTSETKTMLYQDYIELVLLYIRKGLFIPVNYYKLNFRSINPERKVESSYTSMIDSYIIKPNGAISKHPLESYGIDFTPASKILIFTSVTNELQNPLFTLEDYLEVDV